MIVKMAVKDTPTLLGNKLKQTYCRVSGVDVKLASSTVSHGELPYCNCVAAIFDNRKKLYLQGDNYFELDVDVGSSSVARYANLC